MKVLSRVKEDKILSFVASSNLIQHLSDMLYTSARAAIGELVVNSHDSDATRVDITVKNGVLTIKDEGQGMDRAGLERWCRKGSPVKRANDTQVSKSGRLLVGSKGLGSLAMFRLGQEIELKTMCDGVCRTVQLSREDFENDCALEDVKFTPKTYKARGHGTTITIRQLDPRVNENAITLLAIRQYLASNLPATPDFAVYLNGQRCAVNAVNARKRIPIKLETPLNGRIEGELVFAKLPLDEPGLRITVRGRAVGRPMFFGAERVSTHNQRGGDFIRFLTGTVEITGFDPVVRPKNWKDVILTSREGFVEDHERYIEAFTVISAFLKEAVRDEMRKLENTNRTNKNTKVLEAMTEAMRQLNRAMRTMPELFEQEQNSNGKLKGPKVDQPTPKVNRIDRDNSDDDRKEKDESEHDSEKPEPKERSRFEAGPVTIAGRKYTPEVAPLGENTVECIIDDGAGRVTLNEEHPNFQYLEQTRLAVPYLYRMLADAVACKKNIGAKEAYLTLDQLFRIQSKA